MKITSTLLILLISLYIQAAPSVLFLNPGGPSDPFFNRMIDVMNSSARALDISLSILNSDRDYTLTIDQFYNYIESNGKPDYLLMINEDGIGPKLFNIATFLDIKIILFNEGLSESDQETYGEPGEKFPNWIAQILPEDRMAGYILGKNLIEAAKSVDSLNNIKILALTGSPRTQSSTLRSKGLEHAVAEYGVELLQIVPAHWCENFAYRVVKHAVNRYPEISIIWAASDLMAEGARRAAEEIGISPLIGGIDATDFAIENVKNGLFHTTVGGHFIDGFWALLLAHDHYYLGQIPTNTFRASSYIAITKETLEKTGISALQKNWSNIRFHRFSKYYNSEADYTFNIEEILP